MNPIDVVRTRYYNQKYENGKGTLYKTGFDAFKTIVRNEGPRALYKGLTSHFMRIGPHFCCKTLVQTKSSYIFIFGYPS